MKPVFDENKTLRLLDLFCGGGGASEGYARAGFNEIVGVDIKPQPNYPVNFSKVRFVQADALEYLAEYGHDFDAIHASPPCQAHSALKHLHPHKNYECFIERTRTLLAGFACPWVIENVPGAPLKNPVTVCGSAFGLKVRRHRIFESDAPLVGTVCKHKEQGSPIDVSGTGGQRVNRRKDDHGGACNKPRGLSEARNIMEMGWATRSSANKSFTTWHH
jgi:DNA (cytosine-5)-methyltransferase 1